MTPSSPATELVVAFVTAARAARRAWVGADGHARRQGIAAYATADRKKILRARRLIDLALDESANPHERALALTNCAELLAEVDVAMSAATAPLRKQLAEATALQLVEKHTTTD